MLALIDTNLMVYAFSALCGDITPQGAASISILRSTTGVSISAMSWFEIHRCINPHMRSTLDKLERVCGDLNVISIDEQIAFRAAELLAIRSTDPSVCRHCLGIKGGVSCKGCKSRLSKTQRFADAMIVATADCNPDIDVLYTFDAGVLDMGRLVTGCDIRNPMTVEAPADAHP